MFKPDGKTPLAPCEPLNATPQGAQRLPAAPAAETEALRAAIVQTADLQFQHQDLRAARDTLASLEQLKAHTPETLQALGNLCFLLQDYDAAAAAFSRVLVQKPNEAGLWVCQALVRLRQQDMPSFESCLTRALNLDPENVEALKLRADWLLGQGDYAQAGKTYAKLIGRHPNQVEVLLLLAKCFFQGGDRQTTEVVLKRVLALDPLNAVALENLAVLTGNASPARQGSQPSNPASPAPVTAVQSNMVGGRVTGRVEPPLAQAQPSAAAATAKTTPVRKLCLASFFSPSDNDGWRWLKLYQDALAQQGTELVVLSCVPSPDPQVRTIILPLWMHGYRQAYGVPETPTMLEAPLLSTLAERDRAWSGQHDRPLAEFTAGLATCQHVLRTLLDELKPSAMLIWSDILPQSIVLQHLGQQRGVPSWIIERGLLPETLMVEMAGQVGQSELNRSFTLRQALQRHTGTELFDAAQARYRAMRETKYAQADFLDAEAFQRKFNPQRRKLVAALLQYDIGSNLFPTEYAAAPIHRTGFASSECTIRELASAAAQQRCLVLVKPHPLDRADYSRLESEYLRVVRDVNLHSLMQAADVVACMTSSTQFEALLYEKPLLLLARSPLANKGIAYEPTTTAQLPAALHAALQQQDFSRRRTVARRYVDFLLRYFSVALTDRSAALPKLRDLAAFIASNATLPTTELSVDERLNAVGKWLSQWEAAAHP